MSRDHHVSTIAPDLFGGDARGAATSNDADTNAHTHTRSGHVLGGCVVGGDTEPHMQPGDVVAARYKLQTVLGVGGYGTVFSALDMLRSRCVAVKVLRNTRAEVLMQFKQEFRGVFELKHPNIVHVSKLGRDDSVWFIVMEFIDGVRITNSPQTPSEQEQASEFTQGHTEVFAPADARRQATPSRDMPAVPRTTRNSGPVLTPTLPVETIRDRIGQLSQGTHALHQFGILHCDLKPSNVLVSYEGRVVILDFGASRYASSLGAHYQHHWIRAGTQAYMAPEARKLREATPGLDWYGIGVMLAEMLTGLHSRVIAANPWKQRVRMLEDISSRLPDYAPMCDLCAQLMHPTPSERAGHKAALLACYGDHAPRIEGGFRRYSPEFVGRHEELSALDEAYAIFEAGRSHAVLVEGAMRNGKNALCEAFLRNISLAPDAPHILVAHCKPDELLSYRAFDGIVDGLSAIIRALPAQEREPYLPFCTPTLCALFPTLRAIGEQLDHTDTSTNLHTALDELQELLQRVSEDHRLVIWMANLDAADDDSLRWIARIFAPGNRPNAFLLLSRSRVDEFHETDVDVDTLGYAIPRITAQPLDKDTAHRAIRAWLPPALQDHTSLITAIRSEGYDRLDAMHALCAIPELFEDLPETLDSDDLLDRRLDALSEETLHVLCALAASLNPAGAPLLAVIAQRDPMNIDHALERLLHTAFIIEESMVVDERYTMLDSRLRDRVLARVDGELKQAFHDRYAMAGKAHAGFNIPHTDIVTHLGFAQKPAEAQRYVLELAVTADQKGDYTAAAQMYLRLFELRDAQGQPIDRNLRRRAAECNLHAGYLFNAARQLGTLAYDAPSPEAARELHQRAAATYTLCGHMEKAQEHNAQIRRRPVSQSTSLLPQAARVPALIARLTRRLATLDVEKSTDDTPTEHALFDLRACRTTGLDIGLLDNTKGVESGLLELDLALDTRSRIPISRALAGLSTLLSAMGQNYRAIATHWAALAVELAEAAKDRVSLEWAHIAQASLTYHQSNYEDAWDTMHASHTWLVQSDSQQWMMMSYSTMHLIYLAHMTGRIDMLHAFYYGGIVETRTRNNRLVEATLTFTGFMTWLIDDAPSAGRVALRRVHLPTHGGNYPLHDFFVAQFSAELSLYEASTDTYIQHIHTLKDHAREPAVRSVELTCLGAEFLRCRLKISHAVSTGTFTRKHMRGIRTSADTFCKNEDLLVHGWGLQLLAAIHILDGEREHAVAYLRKTIEMYETSGISLYAEVVRAAGRAMKLIPPAGNPYDALSKMGIVNPERFVRSYHPYV